MVNMPMGRRALTVLTVVFLAAPLHGQENGFELVERKIRPVLVEHCYKCHSRQASKQRGGLLLDTRQSLRRGGDSGPPIVPGKPAESLLVQSLRHAKPDLKMPKSA